MKSTGNTMRLTMPVHTGVLEQSHGTRQAALCFQACRFSHHQRTTLYSPPGHASAPSVGTDPTGMLCKQHSTRTPKRNVRAPRQTHQQRAPKYGQPRHMTVAHFLWKTYLPAKAPLRAPPSFGLLQRTRPAVCCNRLCALHSSFSSLFGAYVLVTEVSPLLHVRSELVNECSVLDCVARA